MADGPTFSAPYFAAPEARLRAVPDLYSPITRGGTSQPLPVAGYQNMDVMNWFDKLSKGVDLGSKIAKLPIQGMEQVLQKAHIELGKQKAKALQDQVNAINKKYDAMPQTPENLQAKSNELNQAFLLGGEEAVGTQFSQKPTMPVTAYGPEQYRYITAEQGGGGGGGRGGKGVVNVGPLTPAGEATGEEREKAEIAQGLNIQDVNDPAVLAEYNKRHGQTPQQPNQPNQPIDPTRERARRWIYRGTSSSLDNTGNPGVTNVGYNFGLPSIQTGQIPTNQGQFVSNFPGPAPTLNAGYYLNPNGPTPAPTMFA